MAELAKEKARQMRWASAPGRNLKDMKSMTGEDRQLG